MSKFEFSIPSKYCDRLYNFFPLIAPIYSIIPPYRNPKLQKKMVAEANSSRSPGISAKKRQEIVENGQQDESLFSPGFRSVAAMAGWDEEALLVASLIVEDTPDRQFKQKKRTDLQSLKTPPTNSRRLDLLKLYQTEFPPSDYVCV